MHWFDAHLDLALGAVCGRDLTVPLEVLRENDPGPWKPASVTLPELAESGVRVVLGTIFIEPIDPATVTDPARRWPGQYAPGDAERAARLGRAQLEVYHTWRDRGLIAMDLPRLLHADTGLGEIRGGMGVSEFFPRSLESRLAQSPKQAPVHLGVLIEGADCIRSPDELAWWAERGVVAIGLSWAHDSRYAAGNGTPADEDRGLTDLGRALVPAMDELGLVHDLSHLSDKAADELLDLTARPVMASHSNSRRLFAGSGATDQRHLRDETIREIAGRGGVIGLNLYKKFLRDAPEAGWRVDAPAGSNQASIGDAVRHVEHVCDVVGHRRAVGLGSDMDGGFGALDMCAGIERPAHLERLAEVLRDRGWSDSDVAGFAHQNWCRFFGSALSAVHSGRRPGS